MAVTLRQATERRLQDIRAIFAESEVTEHTGRLRYHEGTREVSGRVRGVKHAFPETEKLKQSPKVIAAAIRRHKGKVFRQVHSVVEREMLRKGFSPSRSSGKRSVDPHKGKRYCVHCRELHTKGQHRFHGKGSYHQTHLFSFNPMRKRNPNGRAFGDVPIGTKFYFIEPKYDARGVPRMDRRPYYKVSRFGASLNADGPASVACNASNRIAVEAYPLPRTNPRKRRNPSERVRIYGKVLRIEAQKTGKHLCDSACKKAGHRYYHDFKVKPSMYGLPDGSLLIKK